MEDVGPTLDWLSGKADRIGLIGPIVEYDLALPLLPARAARQGQELDGTALRTPGTPALDADMRAATEAAGATYIGILEAMCPDPAGPCRRRVGMKASEAGLCFDDLRSVLEEEERAGKVTLAGHAVR